MFKRRKPDQPQTSETAALLTDEELDMAEATLPSRSPTAAEPARPPEATRPVDTRPVDTGLGVPPFRPQLAGQPQFSSHSSKETIAMGRAPFANNPPPPPAPAPVPQSAMNSIAARPAPQARPSTERRTLVVGRGISVQGTVQDAERLVVEGTVEASMIHATELSVSPGGVFKGEVEVEDAEVAGTIDGTLTVRGNLVVRGSGRVLGTARCRRLQVEDGGHITGRIEMLTEAAVAKPAADAVA